MVEWEFLLIVFIELDEKLFELFRVEVEHVGNEEIESSRSLEDLLLKRCEAGRMFEVKNLSIAKISVNSYTAFRPEMITTRSKSKAGMNWKRITLIKYQ